MEGGGIFCRCTLAKFSLSIPQKAGTHTRLCINTLTCDFRVSVLGLNHGRTLRRFFVVRVYRSQGLFFTSGGKVAPGLLERGRESHAEKLKITIISASPHFSFFLRLLFGIP